MLKEEGYDLMGAAFEVYNVLGYGLVEEIYQHGLIFAASAYGAHSKRAERPDTAQTNACWSLNPVLALIISDVPGGTSYKTDGTGAFSQNKRPG